MSRRSAFLTVAVAAGALAPAVPAAAAPPTCASLKGKDLAPASQGAKVVRKGGTTYVCIGTRQARAKGLPGGDATVLDVRGAYAAVRARGGKRVDVLDLVQRTRRRLLFNGRNPTGRVVVGQAGEAAAFFGTGTSRQLRGFDADGRSYRLGGGSIPVSSLRHRTTDVIRWDGGEADLRRPRLPCERLGGRRIAVTSTAVRVTAISYRSDFLEGELDGRATRVRACATEHDTVRVIDELVIPNGGAQGRADFLVLGSGGTFILGRSRSEDSEANVTTTVRLIELVSGASRTLPSFGRDDRRPLDDAIVTASGGVAALVEDGDTLRLLARRADGAELELDAGPAASYTGGLRLEGSTVVRWTRDGAEKSADLG